MTCVVRGGEGRGGEDVSVGHGAGEIHAASRRPCGEITPVGVSFRAWGARCCCRSTVKEGGCKDEQASAVVDGRAHVFCEV